MHACVRGVSSVRPITALPILLEQMYRPHSPAGKGWGPLLHAFRRAAWDSCGAQQSPEHCHLVSLRHAVNLFVVMRSQVGTGHAAYAYDPQVGCAPVAAMLAGLLTWHACEQYHDLWPSRSLELNPEARLLQVGSE
jgi:hypothetical protein